MSKQKVHIGKNGPAPCKATKRACRYGGEETHYDNMADANAAYEQQLAQEQEGSFSNATHKKNSESEQDGVKDLAYHQEAVREAQRELKVQEDEYQRARQFVINARNTGGSHHMESAEEILESTSKNVSEARKNLSKQLDLLTLAKRRNKNAVESPSDSEIDVDNAYKKVSDSLESKGVTVEKVSDDTIAIGEPDSNGNAPLALVKAEVGWEIRDPDKRGEVVMSMESITGEKAGSIAATAYNRKMHAKSKSPQQQENRANQILDKLKKRSRLGGRRLNTFEDKVNYIETVKRDNLQASIHELDNTDSELAEMGKTRSMAMEDLRSNIANAFEADQFTNQGSNATPKYTHTTQNKRDQFEKLNVNQKAAYVLSGGRRTELRESETLDNAKRRAWGEAKNLIYFYKGDDEEQERGKHEYLKEADTYLKFWQEADRAQNQ